MNRKRHGQERSHGARMLERQRSVVDEFSQTIYSPFSGCTLDGADEGTLEKAFYLAERQHPLQKSGEISLHRHRQKQSGHFLATLLVSHTSTHRNTVITVK